jgi:NADPH2:quinone reductase
MKAVLCNSFTGPADLRLSEIAEPKPADDEILIDVHAASVSFMDQLLVSGLYQMRPPTPFVPGTEASGVVVAVGEKVTKFALGDRVACSSWTGGYAERMVAKESKSVRLPDGVAFEAAATVLHNYGTAYYALVERARAQRGETVFIPGAAGGIGLAAVDLGRHLGLCVVAGVGSDDKAALVRRYGASDVINYRSEDLRDRIKSITSGEGIDVGFDNVGGAIFELMARLMKWGGRLMPIGFTSGAIPSIPMNLPLLKNYSILGVFVGAWAEKFSAEAARMNDTLMQLLADGRIRPHIDRVLALDEVGDAMRAVANRTVQGRIVLKIRQSALGTAREAGKC